MKFSDNQPNISISLRTFGSDVFYSQINDANKLSNLANMLNNFREKLTTLPTNYLINLFLNLC